MSTYSFRALLHIAAQATDFRASAYQTLTNKYTEDLQSVFKRALKTPEKTLEGAGKRLNPENSYDLHLRRNKGKTSRLYKIYKV